MNLNYLKKTVALAGACIATAWGSAAMAQEPHLYIPDFSIENYEPVTVDIMLDNEVEIVAYSFNIELPEGLEIVQGSIQKTPRFNQSQTIGYQNDTFLVVSMQNLPFSGTEGSVGTFQIQALPGTLGKKVKTGTISLTNIDLVTVNANDSYQGLQETTIVTMVDQAIEEPVNLTLSVTPETVLVNPSGVFNVAVAMENDKPIEGLQLDIVLPDGFTFQNNNGIIFNQTSRLDGGATINPLTNGNLTRVGLVNIMSNLVLSVGEGDFMTFSIVAPEDFEAEEVVVVINNIQASVNFKTIDVDPVSITVNNGVIAYNRAQAEIEALETALTDALATIAEECPDVMEQFTGEEISQQIEDLKNVVETAYNDGSLTPDYDDIMSPVAEINSAIAAMVEEAKAAQQEVVDQGSRDEALETAMNAVSELRTALEEALATIAEECPDVKDEFNGEEITAQIDALEAAIQEAYDNKTIVEDYETLMEPVEGIQAAIEQLVSDAKAAQQDNVESNQALANATETVTGLRTALEEALATIAEECPDVKDNFNGEDISAQIDALEAAIQEAYDNKTIVEDYENIMAPAEEIQAAIEQLIADAKEAQETHDAGVALETARQNANVALNALDQTLADALAQINAECPDVKHMFPGTYIQQQITVLRNAVNAAYENGTLAENYEEIMAPVSEIENSIAQLITDAKAAQQEIDDAENARQEANAEAYAADLAAIEMLREELEEARITIQETYPNYNYAERYLGILDAINTEKTNADAEFENVQDAGTYNYIVDVTGIQTMITEMLEEAESVSVGVEMLKAGELSDGDKIFTLQGAQVSHLQPGQLNIIVRKDGTCHKVFVK